MRNSEIWAEHQRSEFETMSVENTLQTMVPEPYVNHIPTMTGGLGAAELGRFYRDHFIGQWPSDTTITPISRTTGDGQIVDEMLISFTHDSVIDCILPGVAPTVADRSPYSRDRPVSIRQGRARAHLLGSGLGVGPGRSHQSPGSSRCRRGDRSQVEGSNAAKQHSHHGAPRRA